MFIFDISWVEIWWKTVFLLNKHLITVYCFTVAMAPSLNCSCTYHWNMNSLSNQMLKGALLELVAIVTVDHIFCYVNKIILLSLYSFLEASHATMCRSLTILSLLAWCTCLIIITTPSLSCCLSVVNSFASKIKFRCGQTEQSILISLNRGIEKKIIRLSLSLHTFLS